MTKKTPEKLADVRFRGADGKLRKRWTVRKRWASIAPGGFALFDEEKQEFPLRQGQALRGRKGWAYWKAVRPWLGLPAPWAYWKVGTKKEVQDYIKRTHVETFMRQRVEAELDKGRAA